MKISYRTHPILQRLESGELGEMGCSPEDVGEYQKLIPVLDQCWTLLCLEARSNIQLITKPFAEAIAVSFKKFTQDDLLKDFLTESRHGVFLKGAETICYYIHPEPGGGAVMVTFTFVDTTTGPPRLQGFAYSTLDHNLKGKAAVYFTNDQRNGRSSSELLKFHNTYLFAILTFIKYANVETKELPAKQKLDDHIHCKYVNDTSSNIKVLDSTWFTNLVKPHPFVVRWHLRLQPKKKKGLWTKEIIRINEYQKKGYTRKAGILQQA